MGDPISIPGDPISIPISILELDAIPFDRPELVEIMVALQKETPPPIGSGVLLLEAYVPAAIS
jgi:hypothetical protein